MGYFHRHENHPAFAARDRRRGHRPGRASPESRAPLELVKVTRFDAFVADAAALGARKAFADGLLSKRQFNCAILQPAEWTDTVARHFDRFLTASELATTVTYFRTGSGHFLMSSLMKERDARRRGDTNFKRDTPSKKDEADLLAFLETAAGKKFFSKESVMNEAVLHQLSKGRIEKALETCPGEEPRAPTN